jgi:hypothetical protein
MPFCAVFPTHICKKVSHKSPRAVDPDPEKSEVKCKLFLSREIQFLILDFECITALPIDLKDIDPLCCRRLGSSTTLTLLKPPSSQQDMLVTRGWFDDLMA